MPLEDIRRDLSKSHLRLKTKRKRGLEWIIDEGLGRSAIWWDLIKGRRDDHSHHYPFYYDNYCRDFANFNYHTFPILPLIWLGR